MARDALAALEGAATLRAGHAGYSDDAFMHFKVSKVKSQEIEWMQDAGS